jgi:hypothetical protein
MRGHPAPAHVVAECGRGSVPSSSLPLHLARLVQLHLHSLSDATLSRVQSHVAPLHGLHGLPVQRSVDGASAPGQGTGDGHHLHPVARRKKLRLAMQDSVGQR